MKRPATDMDAIARSIGVSKTTVHYALHNTGRISRPLRKRILDLATKLNYRPNLLARSLRSRRTATIGVVTVYLSSTYHAKVVEGIEDAARCAGRSILLACSYADPERERNAVQLLIDKGVDGLIVAPAASEANAEYYRQLVADGIAIVFVDRRIPKLKVASVATDNVTAAHMVGEHLLRLGRRRFGIMLPALHGERPTSVTGRVEGFNRALREAGIPPATEMGPETLDNTSEGAYHAMQRVLADKGAEFDAVFATNDVLAFGSIRALVERGLSVPGDIAVVGVDDHESAAFFQPALTTIRQPMREIGVEATRLLLRQIEEPESALPQQILLEPTLIVRRSCGTKENDIGSSHDV
jgi:LacI family transcriptional regulator